MNQSFGPWSTAMNTGARHELNTFWKRRLAMLPTLSQSAGRATRRAVVVLGILAIGSLALPTLKRGTHAQTVVQVIDSAAGAEDTGDADKFVPAAERPDKPANEPRFRNTLPTVEFLPRLSPDEKKIIAALDQPVTVEFLDLPLEDAITYLKEFAHINIYFDKAQLTDEGVALDQPVTLKLANIRLESTLKLLLRPVELDFLIEDDILKITTRAAARKKLITRTYPVRDLYQGRDQLEESEPPKKPRARGATGTPAKHTDLEEAITRNIDPESWEQWVPGGGPGSLTYVKETGTLVIRQTWSVHRQILQLLRDLREAKRLGQAPPEQGARRPANSAPADEREEPSSARSR
jgi:hypothetical protein